ncbi:uncharacterized protein [Lolium perenne]|uniref:uncharacterized protein isoform X1 n=1 Tax=Lolium perenne TaxID=4522 RepID=UPI003A99B80F
MVGPRPARTRAFRVASASKVRTSAPRRHRARFVPLPAPVGFVSAGLPKRKWDGFFPVVSPEVATRNRKRRKVIHDRQRGRTPDAPFTSPLEPLWVGFTTEEVDILKAGYADKSYYGGPDYRCGRCKASFWYQERVKSASAITERRVVYNNCCKGGKVFIAPFKEPPEFLRALLDFDGTVII